MFQLQMTGYMFKNAEYRLSLSQSLGQSDRMLPGSGVGNNDDDDAVALKQGKGRLKGKIKVRYGASNASPDDNDDEDKKNNKVEGEEEVDEQPKSELFSPGMEVEVNAQSYLSELSGEVHRLRDELDVAKQAKEEEIRKDLL